LQGVFSAFFVHRPIGKGSSRIKGRLEAADEPASSEKPLTADAAEIGLKRKLLLECVIDGEMRSTITVAPHDERDRIAPMIAFELRHALGNWNELHSHILVVFARSARAIHAYILGRLRHLTFFSLAECNAAIALVMQRMNERPMRNLGLSRRELFETIGAAPPKRPRHGASST